MAKPNPLLQYDQVKQEMRPGDFIAFWGSGVFSFLVNLFASGPTHCAIVSYAATDETEVRIIESTIRNGVNGVQTVSLRDRIATYDGAMAWVPLSADTRDRLKFELFYQACAEVESHVKYGIDDLFGYLIRQIPVLGPRLCQRADSKEMVCSSLVVWLFMRAGILNHLNWSEYTPQDLFEMNLFRGDIVPLLRRVPRISRFNTL